MVPKLQQCKIVKKSSLKRGGVGSERVFYQRGCHCQVLFDKVIGLLKEGSNNSVSSIIVLSMRAVVQGSVFGWRFMVSTQSL